MNTDLARTHPALFETLRLHQAYVEGSSPGARANLECADLRDLDLREARLDGAHLAWANLAGADLRSATLTGACFDGANLDGADLSHANLSGAYLRRASLEGALLFRTDAGHASLQRANLREANLRNARLRYANLAVATLDGAELDRAELHSARLDGASLVGASLRMADLRDARLQDANLEGAQFEGASLAAVDLSGARGLLDPAQYLRDHFQRTVQGYLVYKQIGLSYSPPARWAIAEGAVLTEVVQPDRTDSCACGVNVATWQWLRDNGNCREPVWRCLLAWEDLPGVVVPYNTNGKIRCGRVTLLEWFASIDEVALDLGVSLEEDEDA
jgi:uncharacterized protein YjbI with pentapeptide repeats